MMVTDDGAGLAPGTLGDAIDGILTQAILEHMLPLARADGHNDAKRIASLQVQGTDRFEAFDVYFSLLYPARADTIEHPRPVI